jgi:hypothetical protein
MIDHGFELMEVSNCISGSNPVDENVLSSVAILQDRLERLKNTSNLFAGVTFSDDIEALAQCHLPTALC